MKKLLFICLIAIAFIPKISYGAIADNLVSYNNLNSNSINSIGSYNGTDTNITYSSTNAILGSSANFIASSPSRISFPTASSFLNLTTFTISAWVKTSSPSYQGIILLGSNIGGTVNSPYLRVDNNFKVSLLAAGTALIGTSNSAIVSGALTYIVALYDVSGNWKIYINGSLSGSGTNLLTFTFSGGGIFGTESTNAEKFTGSLDEIGIWSRVLSLTEVTSLYNSGAGLTYPFVTSIPGCMDSTAINYNSLATVSDNSCTYTTPVATSTLQVASSSAITALGFLTCTSSVPLLSSGVSPTSTSSLWNFSVVQCAIPSFSFPGLTFLRSFGDITFGIALIIFLLSSIFVGLLFSAMKFKGFNK